MGQRVLALGVDFDGIDGLTLFWLGVLVTMGWDGMRRTWQDGLMVAMSDGSYE